METIASLNNVSVPQILSHTYKKLASLEPKIKVLALVLAYLSYRFSESALSSLKKRLSNYHFNYCHGGFCNGSVEVGAANKIIEKIQNVSEHIAFEKLKKNNDSIGGGCCSSVSLDFAFEVLQAAKKNKRSFFQSKYSEGFKNFTKWDWKKCQNYRNEQAALNAFQVKESSRNHPNISTEKVRVIAAAKGMTVVESSKIFDVRYSTEADIEQQLKTLKQGIYLVRQIKPNEGPKLEEHGHSMILIHDSEEGDYFFDANFGNFLLGKDRLPESLSQYRWSSVPASKVALELSTFATCNYRSFQTSELQFHKLELESPILSSQQGVQLTRSTD